MKIESRIAVLALVIFSLSGLPASAQRSKAAVSSSAHSHARARKVLEAGIAALGGLEAIRETQDVSVKVSGFSYARNQSVSVNPPYDKMTRDENLYIDLRNRKYIIETRDPLPGGFVFGGKQVINGNQGFFVNPRDRTIAPLNLANFNNIGIVRRLPHLFLIAAYENAPASLRWRGQEAYDGRMHNVITFASSNGVLWTLFFDARSNLLKKYEQMVSDNLMGDAVQETVFPGYRTVGKLKVPTGRATRRAGELIEEVNYTEVQFNTRPGDSAFAKPEGFEELPQPTPPPTRETKLTDGVYLFESGSNSLVVEFTDYVLVVEPYAGGRGPKPTINKVREMFPNKPINYVVVLHHHDDHSGGLRSYIAEGITIVTTPANQRYFETMAASEFTINRDDQTQNKRKPVFQFVDNKKRVFTDGRQTVEIIDIGPSPHAKEMLVAYLPKEKLVFQGDLLNLPNSGKYMPTTINETTVHFFDTIKRLGLDVDRIAAVHGPTTTLDDLRKAIEKSRPLAAAIPPSTGIVSGREEIGTMSLKQKIISDLTASMKAQDVARLSTLRMVKAGMMNREIEKGGELDDEEMAKLLRSMVKQRRDSVEQYEKGGRQDLAEKEKTEIGVIEAYLPQPASPEEIEQAVIAAISETGAASMKDMGKVMKAAQTALAGKNADGRSVSEMVKTKLGG